MMGSFLLAAVVNEGSVQIWLPSRDAWSIVGMALEAFIRVVKMTAAKTKMESKVRK